jgi:FHA domain
MGSWNAVIDVSNVCWSPHLPPLGRQEPVWERLALVMAAWREQHGDDAQFELVADESLVRVLGPDTPRFLELKRSGGIRTASVADDEILALARDKDLHVITRDHYTDHRGQHRWIEQSPQRFHAWDTVDGTVRLTPLGIRRRSAQDVSQAREVKVLRFSAKLDARNQAHRKFLQTRWNCPNTACRQAAQWQGQLLAWPRISPEGAAVCPSCTRPLVDLGPRSALHEVVVAELASQEEILRFPLEVDCPVIVGRGAAVKGIDLSMYAGSGRTAIETVSRQHLVMRLTSAGAANWRLSVTDLNSTNGTMVQRWAGSSFDTVQQVAPDRETHLGTRDRVVLGESVLLRLSGKRYLAEPTAFDPGLADQDPEPSATTVVRLAALKPLAEPPPPPPPLEEQ